MTEAKQSFLIILWPIQTLAHANTDFHNVLSWCLYETKTPGVTTTQIVASSA